ncbi:hypothetical protein ASG25_13315 [Rhizobium sp. Leaf384]|uniref:hypothetical protein n=1 Tax=unclassified Rhizobium TaxID=2613769 RepID=UPI0007139423|nr:MULTISPECIES: hypothetical protein [unclassified Rhizobium]KQS78069.1 hypothetical protein ASG58_06565 [Rhizobium sp. Leaf383]KQS79488.1 hypothetical protein ASG25_13315 [Rhizobium sp. Leaf384]
MTYRKYISIAVLAVIAAVLIGTMAFAQDAAPVVARSSIWFDLWQILQPLVVMFGSIVGPVLITWIGARVIALLKITDVAKRLEIETQLRNAIHASAANAIRFAVAKAGLVPGAVITPQLIETATSYVVEKNPDALARLGVTEDMLREIITSKVPDLVKVVSAPVRT